MAPACSSLNHRITLKTVTLGREANKTSVNIAECPSSSVKPTVKAQAFSTTVLAIDRYIGTYDYAEVSSCLLSAIPGHHSFTNDQVLTFESTLLDQPFTVTNLTALGFPNLNGQMKPLSVLMHGAHDRPAGLTYLRIQFTVNFSALALTNTDLSKLAPFTSTYDMALPQTVIPQGRSLFGDLARLHHPTTPGPGAVPQSRAQSLLRTVQRSVANIFLNANPTDTPGPPTPMTTPPPTTVCAYNQPTTFTGDLTFLTDQALFDSLVPQRPAFHSSITIAWNTAIKHALWNTLTQLLRLRYVGYAGDVLSTMTSEDISSLFRNLKMVTTPSTKTDEYNNPDDLYEAFTERLPALPDDATNWPISLPHSYFEALPPEHRDALEADGFVQALRSTLHDKRSQYDALGDTRSAAVQSWFKLSKQTASLQRLLKATSSSVRAFTSNIGSRKSTQQSEELPTSQGDPLPPVFQW